MELSYPDLNLRVQVTGQWPEGISKISRQDDFKVRKTEVSLMFMSYNVLWSNLKTVEIRAK